MTTTSNNPKCEELEEALDMARAALESSAMRDETADIAGAIVQVAAVDAAVSQPELMKEIEEIQQAMRDAGCP